MAGRRSQFRLPGVRTWVDNIKNEVSREAARSIVTDLKLLGPWYTGEFEKAWVVRLGDVRIRGDTPALPFSKRRLTENVAPTPFTVPKPRGRKSIFYTIGNRMEYRDLAMDLVPGRVAENKRNSAPKDWYRSYIEGGNLRLTLEQSTKRVSEDPKIKGFKR